MIIHLITLGFFSECNSEDLMQDDNNITKLIGSKIVVLETENVIYFL